MDDGDYGDEGGDDDFGFADDGFGDADQSDDSDILRVLLGKYQEQDLKEIVGNAIKTIGKNTVMKIISSKNNDGDKLVSKAEEAAIKDLFK